VLSEEGEKIIALSGESRTAIRKTFSNLTNVDLKFGEIEVGEEAKPLSQSTFSVFLQNPDPKIRKAAYEQFYGEFKDHEHTLGSLLAGSVQDDVYIARVRGHKSARARSLFPDNVPESVYDNLIGVIHEHLPLLHDYYDFRQKVLGLEKLHHCDVYAPLTDKLDSTIPYDEAVALTTAALEPLGTEYTSTMDQGLKGGWVDRYENKGKRSGAFSAGSFMGDPYILLNYKPDNIRDLFTLAHEAGHSMHSWYSVRNNPFSHYNYTIFEAEVASTFNEQLLAHHLLKTNPDQDFQDYLDGKLLDDAIATIFRQTMFAEFEHLIHREVEEGKGLPLDKLKELYRGLLEQYFGPKVVFEDYSALEGLRIPHFYSAFYVYKYATGLSAAMALSQRVLNGGESETQDYLGFLKSGGSRFPLESLALAGVDMSQEAPIRAAMGLFKEKLDSLKARKGL
jgi:oligoendopeptidase F